jgi:hypothetical protein
LDDIVLTADPEKPYESFTETHAAQSQQFEDVMKHILLPDKEADAHFAKLERMWQFKCPLCDSAGIQTLQELTKHVQKEHAVKFWYIISLLFYSL